MSIVAQWLNTRWLVHAIIVVLFVAPALWLVSVRDISDDSLQSKVKLAFDGLEDSTINLRVRDGRRASVRSDIIFVGIDQTSMPDYLRSALAPDVVASSPALSLMCASFPYSRDVYAMTFDRLLGAGARVVLVDLLFPNPSEHDDVLRAALDRHRGKAVIGSAFGFDESKHSNKPFLMSPSLALLPEGNNADERMGYVNYWPDSDGVVRDVQYRCNLEFLSGIEGAEDVPKAYSLAARAVQFAGHPELVPNDLLPRTFRLAGPPAATFPTISLYRIFDPTDWSRDCHDGAVFRDKIVVVGPQGNFLKDQLNTAFGLMDGAEIHLNAINALLQNEFLHRASLTLTLLSVIAAGGIAFALAFLVVAVAWRFLAVVVIVAGYIGALIVAYNSPGWLLPAVAPMGVFCGATGVGFIYDFVLTQVEKLRLRATFERYNSKNVVKYLLDHTTSYKDMLKGTRRPVTVLFSDIRSFTTIVEEAVDSQALVDQLNEYFTEMVDCVFRFDGSLDKFMGDGIMAVWGNTPYNFGPKGDAARAVRAGLAMGEALERLNKKWLAEGRKEWQIGIGLNYGQVIVGDMGSQQHKEFGVVGDAINLGSRLEGLTKEYHLRLLIGESVAELVQSEFVLRSVDVVQVKGRSQPVKTYAVLGEKSAVMPLEKEKFLALHEEGMTAFRRRDFARAREVWAQALQLQPDDFILAAYMQSCAELIENPPDEKWTGVRVMKSK